MHQQPRNMNQPRQNLMGSRQGQERTQADRRTAATETASSQERINRRDLPRIDTNIANASRRPRFEVLSRSTNEPPRQDQRSEYQTYRGMSTAVPPPPNREATLTRNFSRRDPARNHSTNRQISHQLSFELNAPDDSLIIGQSYHQKKETSRDEKSVSPELRSRSRNRRTRSVDRDSWRPSPPLSEDGWHNDDSPVSGISDYIPSAPNGARLGSIRPRSPTFIPTLEILRRRQLRESGQILYFDPDPVNNRRPPTKQLARGVKARPPRNREKRTEESTGRTSAEADWVSVSEAPSRLSNTFALEARQPSRKKTKPQQQDKQCVVM